MTARSLALAVLTAATLSWSAAPAHAQSRRAKVELEVHALFGSELLSTNSYAPLVISATNRTNETFRGTVEVNVRAWQGAPVRHELRLDLPPRATRRGLIEVFVLDGTNIEARYVVDDEALAETTLSPGYNPGGAGLVILADPPRLRGNLLDMSSTIPAVGPYGSPRAVTVPIGVVTMDPDTGDPVLPHSPAGWAQVGLLVASAPDLARVTGIERQALVDWIRSGGQLLVFPRTEADLADPSLQELVGVIERFEAGEAPSQVQLVPEGARGVYYRSADGSSLRPFTTEWFGGSRALGFGRVYVATFDGTAPPHAEAPQTRELIRSIVDAPRALGSDVPFLSFGSGHDDMTAGSWGVGNTFGSLRSVLDPNEGYRPALGLVAVVLFLYVILVGPVNFAIIGRRNRPTLALITTPVAALACLVVMLGVGYIGKGTTMRYRAIDIVEAMEGDTAVPARRYSGLFLTRPASFDVQSPERGASRILAAGDATRITDHGEATPLHRNVRGQLWETVFYREDRIVELDGAITFVRNDRQLVAVDNGTSQPLRGAVLIDPVGGVYPVGDIPAGGRGSVGPSAVVTIQTNAYWYGANPSVGDLAREMRLGEDGEKTLEGVQRVLGGNLTASPVPTLFAWQEVERRGEVAGTFSPETDLRFIRVVPDRGRAEAQPPVQAIEMDEEVLP